ncbi:hypothetical protein PAXRUDRAFT_149640, partial [Paxillus rubicundulus Ve08.2h10]
PYNVVFIGETGVGKSSVIQRIAGTETGTINNDTAGATTLSKASDVTIHAKRYHIWDTAGLGEGSEGRVPAKEAEKALKKLLSDLTQSRGVHLLVFCMRQGRITTALEGIYRKFVLGVCQEKVPAVLVVTGLDVEAEREGWWTRNGAKFEGHGMRFRGNACVGWAPRDPAGAETLRSLISQYADRGITGRPKEKKGGFCIIA